MAVIPAQPSVNKRPGSQIGKGAIVFPSLLRATFASVGKGREREGAEGSQKTPEEPWCCMHVYHIPHTRGDINPTSVSLERVQQQAHTESDRLPIVHTPAEPSRAVRGIP